MKKIVLYGINYAPEPIGVGRFSGELGLYLASKGIQVDVVTAIPHYPGWTVRNGFANWYSVERKSHEKIVRCPILLKKNLRGIWRLVAPLSFAISSAPVAFWQILSNRPDVVLCVEPTFLSAPVALFAAKLVGSRCFLHVQDLEIDAAFALNHLKGRRLRKMAIWLESATMRLFDGVITISYRMAAKIVEKGLVKEKVEVIRNWVDLEKIYPLADVSAYRAELGIPQDKFVALYSGNIGPKQSLSSVLEAARHLRSVPSILFVIVGEGPEKQRLIAQSHDLTNVRFLPLQPENRLCELLNAANAHLLPQDKGAADLVLPSKLGGMLASGKPCFVMAEGGSELFDFLVGSAILIPPGDTEKLAAAILACFNQEYLAPIDPAKAEIFDARHCLAAFQSALGLAPN